MKKIFILIILIFSAGCSNIKENNSREIEKREYIFLKGLNFYQKGKKREALEEYKKVYDIDPENVILLKEMALVYYELGESLEAIALLEKAEKLSPKDVDIKKNLSIVYCSIGDIEKAEKYLEMIPNRNDEITGLRGRIAFKKKDYKTAYNYLKNTEPMFYEDNFYLMLKGSMLELGKETELYTFLNDTYEKYYDKKDFIILYCTSLSEVFNETDFAIKTVMRYISQYGGDDDLFIFLSNLYLKNNERENAVNSFKMVSRDNEYNKEYIELKNKIRDTDN